MTSSPPAAKKKKIATIAALLLKKKKKSEQPINQRRAQEWSWDNVVNEMRFFDEDLFFSYTRLNMTQFDLLLSLVEERLTKVNTFRTSVPSGARLAITLRFLATGDSLSSLASAFKIGKSTACVIIKHTCDILWEVLSEKYVKFPSCTEWKIIAEDFENTWNLPHCIGAIDARHVEIQVPSHSGPTANYKKTDMIVLFAICDSNLLFRSVDLGVYDSEGDGGVLRESNIGNIIFNNALDIPEEHNIGETNIKMSYYFIGDESFPLHQHLIRPYGGRNLKTEEKIFNFRLSRAYNCIDNAFGVLVARFKIFHRIINANPQTVDSIVKAAIGLHNFIISTSSNSGYCPNDYVDHYDDEGVNVQGGWRRDVPKKPALADIKQLRRRIGSRNATRTAESYREMLKCYVNNEVGSIPQQKHII